MIIQTRPILTLLALAALTPFVWSQEKPSAETPAGPPASEPQSPPEAPAPAPPEQPAGPDALDPRPRDTAPAQQTSQPPAATTAKPPAVSTANREETTGLESLFSSIPEGKTHEGVRYPIMDEDQLTGFLRSERITRIGESRLQFEDAIIQQFGADPMTFEFIIGTYDKEADVLQSSQPVVIRSTGYKLEGDTFNYDRATSESKMSGRVRMTIFELPDARDGAGKKNRPEPSPAPDDVPVPDPAKDTNVKKPSEQP